MESLHEVVFERLAAGHVPAATAETILAALSGDHDFENVLGGRPPVLDIPSIAAAATGPSIFLSSVSVAGFRGVGPERTLSLHPGPGLTVVVGRNGSGKSSFAEAVELCLTGDSARWADKNSVWRTGWRNLHTSEPCRIAAELRLDGEAKPVRVTRSWPAGAELGAVELTVSGATTDVADLRRPLELYRPFLTATELAKLLAGTPSELFDALGGILGMDAITAADKRLGAAIRAIDTRTKEIRVRRDVLLDALDVIDDDRARAVATLIRSTTVDHGAVEAVLAGRTSSDPASAVGACESVASLAVADSDHVLGVSTELLAAARLADDYGGVESRTAINVAELLRVALDYHAEAGDGHCPVCEIGGLDQPWRTHAEVRLATFRVASAEARRAETRLREAIRKARDLVANPPVLPDEDPVGVPLDELRGAIRAFAVSPPDPRDFAYHLVTTYQPMLEAVLDARERASAWIAAHDGAWAAAVADVRGWLDAARVSSGDQAMLRTLKDARAWLKDCEKDIRDRRMAPFAEKSQEIWRQLRQESNVELGMLTLTGTSTRRHVEIPVTVDGVDNGTALGVMSQGEMQALGLALFLPRSCADESPFRFIVVDDPVQSMDPAKVDGLAQVLARLGEDRQVVVFTHDGRLPDAIRRLEIDARILEVVRAERSVVTIRPCGDPVSRYLDDANAVARSTDLAEAVRHPVVTAMCRAAIEAACHDAVWRTRLERGIRHAEIEAALDAIKRTLPLVALALFDDEGRAGDVMGFLKRKHGVRFVDALTTAREGVHGHYAGDLPQLVRDVRDLTAALR